MAVLAVIERIMPIAERFIPQPGQGATKREIVLGSAEGVAATTLPGVNMRDPRVQAAMDAKLAADVALANLLQSLATPQP
jgi:hypothetical protein